MRMREYIKNIFENIIVCLKFATSFTEKRKSMPSIFFLKNEVRRNASEIALFSRLTWKPISPSPVGRSRLFGNSRRAAVGTWNDRESKNVEGKEALRRQRWRRTGGQAPGRRGRRTLRVLRRRHRCRRDIEEQEGGCEELERQGVRRHPRILRQGRQDPPHPQRNITSARSVENTAR